MSDDEPSSGLISASLRSWIQDWSRELAGEIEAEKGVRIEVLPVRFVDSGDMNASVVSVGGAAELSINEHLIVLLYTFNSSFAHAAIEALGGTLDDWGSSQSILDATLRIVFSMQPPEAATPALEELTGIPAWRKSRPSSNVDPGVVASRLAEIGASASYLTDARRLILPMFSDPVQLANLLEWQLKFILAHELAHVALGHTHGAASEDDEVAADAVAATIVFRQIRSHPGRKELDAAPVAVPLLFLAMRFVEDLRRIANRGIRFALTTGFKDAYRETPYRHPPTNARIAALYGAFPEDLGDLVRSIAIVAEHGVFCLKWQFRAGVLDLRHFKWYCRIRAIEMTSAWIMRRLDEQGRRMMAEKLITMRGWDTADLRPGPLVADVFDDAWFTRMLGELEPK